MRCFFSDVPSLIETDFAAMLFVYTLMLVRTSNACLMKLLKLMWRLSRAAVPMAYSSDFADESAVLAHVTSPVALVLVVSHDAQLASV